MSDSILSMEEVAAIKAALAQLDIPGAKSQARATWEAMERLIATAEHWHREAQGKASVGAGIAALKDAFESTIPRDAHAAVVEERDRLRDLVAGMREALELAAPIIGAVEDGAEDPPVSLAIAAVLVDLDGQLAYELAAKDREAAEKWRAMMEATDPNTPEHAAFIEKATAAIAEGEEELRLLRELEAADNACAGTPIKTTARGFAETRRLDARVALAAFRARQKGSEP